MSIEVQQDRRPSPASELSERYRSAKQFIADNGVFIKHFRETAYVQEGRFVNQFGGMTVAYRKEGNFLQVATAVCSDQDNYNGKLGTALATERLANNHFILVPLRDADLHELVVDMFIDHFENFSMMPGYDDFDMAELVAAKGAFVIRPGAEGGFGFSPVQGLEALRELLAKGGVADLKSSFSTVPPSDLLAALRNSPHAKAASGFLANLLHKNLGGSAPRD